MKTRTIVTIAGLFALVLVAVPILFVFLRPPLVIAAPPMSFIAGPLNQFDSPGVYQQFQNQQGVFLVRLSQGPLVALNATCTHRGCTINWLSTDKNFKCPCFGSIFDMSGINVSGPATRPLERHRIMLDGNNVLVDRSVRFRYENGGWNDPDSFIANTTIP